MLFTPCCAAPYLFSERLPLHEQFLTSEPPMELRTIQPTTTGTHGFRVYPRQGQAFWLREGPIAAIECAYVREDVRFPSIGRRRST